MQDRYSASGPLIDAALRQFAAVGFDGASLQRIAADAGLSKSSVLYHFTSKEALLDAALRPAVDDLRVLLDQLGAVERVDTAFASRFVDYLYLHRLAVSVLINHGRGLEGHAVIDDADALVRSLAARLTPQDEAAGIDAARFGVALAGAAFMLVAADRWSVCPVPDEALRSAVTAVVAELLAGEPQPV